MGHFLERNSVTAVIKILIASLVHINWTGNLLVQSKLNSLHLRKHIKIDITQEIKNLINLTDALQTLTNIYAEMLQVVFKCII